MSTYIFRPSLKTSHIYFAAPKELLPDLGRSLQNIVESVTNVSLVPSLVSDDPYKLEMYIADKNSSFADVILFQSELGCFGRELEGISGGQIFLTETFFPNIPLNWSNENRYRESIAQAFEATLQKHLTIGKN